MSPAPGRAPGGSATAALLVLLTFGCATVKPPLPPPSPAPEVTRVAVLEPEIELWVEDGSALPAPEVEKVLAEARAALDAALARVPSDPDPEAILRVRERAVAVTAARETQQVLAVAGIVVAAVAFVVVVIVLIVALGGDDTGPGNVIPSPAPPRIAAAPPRAAPAPPRAAAGPPPVAPAPPAAGHAATPAPPPVALGPSAAPQAPPQAGRPTVPAPPPATLATAPAPPRGGGVPMAPPRWVGVTPAPPRPVPPAPWHPPSLHPPIPWTPVPGPYAPPPWLEVDLSFWIDWTLQLAAAPEPEAEAPPETSSAAGIAATLGIPPAAWTQTSLDLDARGFWDGDETILDFALEDPVTGEVLWTATVRSHADPRHRGAMAELVREALGTASFLR